MLFVVFGSFVISYVGNFSKLAEPPFVDSIEWSKWHVFWVDERVVPKTHEDSNYKLAYDGFLSKVFLFRLSDVCLDTISPEHVLLIFFL